MVAAVLGDEWARQWAAPMYGVASFACLQGLLSSMMVHGDRHSMSTTRT